MWVGFICNQKAKTEQDSSWRADFCYGQEANTLLELWCRVFPAGCSTSNRDGCFLDQP